MARRPPVTPEDQISFARELLRKATHLGALVVPGGYYLLGLSRAEALYIMVPATVLMILIDVARLRGWSFWSRIGRRFIGPLIRSHEEAGDFTGAFYILITFCVCIAAFSKPVAVAAMAFIVVGDSLAALVGRRLGRHHLWGTASLEGSLACLAGTLIVAFVVPDLTRQVALTGAVVAALVESLPAGIDDNVTVPIASGLAMTVLDRFLTFS
jgi:dolichol kinase